MSAARMPAIEFERAPCPRCGAETADAAGKICRPSSDETGEYWCPAGEEEDADGYILQPTAASLKRRDEWFSAEQSKDPQL